MRIKGENLVFGIISVPKSNGSGTIAMGFLHASGGRGRLASSLGSELFPRSLSSSGFASSLLCTSHLKISRFQLVLILKLNAIKEVKEW